MFKKTISLLLIIATVLSMNFISINVSAATAASYAATLTADVAVKGSASTSASTLTTLKKGTYITALSEESDGWVKVEYIASMFGYVQSSYLTKVSGSKAAFVNTTSGALNVRASASADGTKITALNRGAYFIVLSEANGWCKILYNGVSTGYVTSQYVGYPNGAVTVNMTEKEKAVASNFAQTALNEVGYVEGSNNYSKYGEYFGKPNYYWCDAFVNWCAVMTDSSLYGTAFPKLRGCTNIMKWYINNNRFYYATSGYVPKVGDLIFFDRSGSSTFGSTSNHMGIVYKVDDSYVYTVEGNTSDAVKCRAYKRDYTYTIGYAFPNFAKATGSTSTTTTTTKTTTSSSSAQIGTVTATVLNVRSGAGSSYPVISTVSKGATVTILGTSGSWYKIKTANGKTGYASKDYISVSGSTTTTTTTPKPTTTTTKTTTTAAATTTGKVTATVLNVRSGAGTSYSVVTKLSKGAVVTILGTSGTWYQIKTANGKTGYVSKEYISVITPATTTTTTKTTTTTTKTTTTAAATKKGTVKATKLNVRSGAGTSYSIVTTLPNGAVVTILGTSGTWYQIKTSDGKTGYVSKEYIVISAATTTTTTTPKPTTTKTTTTAAATNKGTVNATKLNVRSGAGTSYSIVTTLSKGAVVTVLGTSGSWYKIKTSDGKTGYVSKDYLIVSTATTTTTTTKTTTTTTKTTTTASAVKTGKVTANLLNVRSGAGTSYSVISTLSKGTTVTILGTSGTWYQIKLANGKTGYVSKEYISL